MSLITTSIPNLVNGISQQPNTLRMASQAQKQINGLSTVTDGLKKRPAFRHIAKILGSSVGDAYMHVINRDKQEKYVACFFDGSIRVFSIDGTEVTVNTVNGSDYLDASSPKEAFDVVTVADYTFIVNKERTIQESSELTATRDSEALFWVQQGDYGCTYTAWVDGQSGSYETPDGSESAHANNVATDYIAQQVGNDLDSSLGSGYTVTVNGSVIHVTKNSGEIDAKSEDSLGNNGMKALGPSIQRFSDLPPSAPESFEVEIAGDQSSSFNNYYVRFHKGVWKETSGQGIPDKFDNNTMPHTLIRQADGTFEFGPVDWDGRGIGDGESNPFPSFTGQTITGVFFHRNRLGFIAGENVVMSKAGEFFNFFRQTATQLLDDDPIDVAVSHVKVSLLRHAIPFNETLLLFSDQTQFQLGRAEILTPETVSINQTTEYETSLRAQPAAAGRYIYFMVNRGGYSGVREYYVDRDTQVSEAADITGHVPRYIPGRVFKMASSSNEDVLALLSEEAQNELYIYKFYWMDQEKIQSSWSTWNLGGDAKILSCEFIESDLFIIVERPDGVSLEMASFDPGYTSPGMDFPVHLDRLVDDSRMTISFDGEDSTIELPYKTEDLEDLEIITRDGGEITAGLILEMDVDNSGANTVITVPNRDLREEGLFAGLRYEFRYRFSELALREEALGGGESTISSGRTQLRKMSILFADSGYFRVEVHPFRRGTYEYVFSGRRVGSARNPIGQISIDEGRFDFPIQCENKQVEIDLVSDSYLPCAFLNGEWEAFYYNRSRRM